MEKAIQKTTKKDTQESNGTTNATTTSKEGKGMKEMEETKTLEQKLQALEEVKKELKAQINEQKKTERLEAQIQDKVANLLEKFAQIGLQLTTNAETIAEGTNNENLRALSVELTKSFEMLKTTFETFNIDLQELKDKVKPLATTTAGRTPRPRRTLSELGIKDGAIVVHMSTGSEYIVSNDKILYNDNEMALSKVASILKNGQSRSGFRDFRLKEYNECLADMPSVM